MKRTKLLKVITLFLVVGIAAASVYHVKASKADEQTIYAVCIWMVCMSVV